jgi:hypothetical protein
VGFRGAPSGEFFRRAALAAISPEGYSRPGVARYGVWSPVNRVCHISWAVVLALACAPAVLSPVDPQHQLAIEALGPENPQVPVGPLHRPGQSCMLCHDVGEDATPFNIAGTVYRDNVSTAPLIDAEVLLVDAAANRFTAHTNCVGNFYVGVADFEPAWPFWVTVRQGANDSVMGSPVHRERSCAACHFEPAGPRTAGHVYLTSDDLIVPMIPVRACRPDEGNY